MLRTAAASTVGLALLVLVPAGCSSDNPSTSGSGGSGTTTGGSGGGGRGGAGGASAGGSGGSAGGQGGSAAGGSAGGTGGSAGGTGGSSGGTGGSSGGSGGAVGGTGGSGSDGRPSDGPSTTGDGALAGLDAFCTPKVVLMVPAGNMGGMRFMTALGGTTEAVTATVQQMGREICRYLYRSADEVRPANEIELIVDAAYTGIAAKSGNVGKVRVRFGANYIANYNGDVAREVKGILYHEMTHIYQHDDKPEGQWVGLADYYESHADAVRTHMGFSSCQAPSKSGTWERGAYCARAHWWLWLENTYPGFLHKLNLQMKGGDGMAWTPARGATIVDKPLDQLWTEYQAAACCAGSNRSCCM